MSEKRNRIGRRPPELARLRGLAVAAAVTLSACALSVEDGNAEGAEQLESLADDVRVIGPEEADHEEQFESGLRKLAREASFLSQVDEQYGASAVNYVKANPGQVRLFAGEYSDETVDFAMAWDAAVNGPEHDYRRAYTGQSAYKALVEKYAPVYYFSDDFENKWCAPQTFDLSKVETCNEGWDYGNEIPVYASITVRPTDHGGGTDSYWINYHVFYGKQKGWGPQNRGAHGQDWESTSVHIIAGTAVAVQYRVHGSAVVMYPWASAPKLNGRPRVYVGRHFHSHYPEPVGFNAAAYLTWQDIAGSSVLRYPSVRVCPASAASDSAGGGSCANFGKNQWADPLRSTKDPEALQKLGLASYPPKANFDVEAPFTPDGAWMVCVYTGRDRRGLEDCYRADARIPLFGGYLNDQISSVRIGGPLQVTLWQHPDWRGERYDSGASANVSSNIEDEATCMKVARE